MERKNHKSCDGYKRLDVEIMTVRPDEGGKYFGHEFI